MPTPKKRKVPPGLRFTDAFRDDEQNKRSFPDRHKRNYKLTSVPLINSKRPGWLRLNNRRINEILFS